MPVSLHSPAAPAAPSAPHLVEAGPGTLVDVIVAQAGGPGSLTVLDAGGEAAELLSWRDLHQRARRMSAVLNRHGIRPGTRVALAGETSADLVAALQAVWLTGATAVVLPPTGPRGGSGGQFRAVLADARVDLVIDDLMTADPVTADPVTAGPVTADPGSPAGLVPPAATAAPVLALADLARYADGTAPATPCRPDPADLALLQYTSGSTRSPHGVPVTHRRLAANVRAIMAVIDPVTRARMLSWLPLYHDLGLIGFLCMPMACGSDLILQPPAAFARRPAGWLPALSRHRATMSGAPNFAYALTLRLLTTGTLPDMDLSAVRCLISGGEPIDAAMMARLAGAGRRYGLDPGALTPAYGLAETTLAATISPTGGGVRVDTVDLDTLETGGLAVPPAPGRPARELVRVGPPVPGTTIRVVDRRTGEPVGDRVVGHIELSGASVVGHYWPDPAAPPGSWLRTGDLGYLTGGELVVCGRAKDVLFAAGRNVFPQDIEAAAAEVPAVRAGGAAAFGVPGTSGDRLVVVVETRGRDHGPVAHAVADAVRAEVGLAPAEVVPVRPGWLPRTTSGKLRRAETRRRYLAGEVPAV